MHQRTKDYSHEESHDIESNHNHCDGLATVGTSQTTNRKPLVERYAERQSVSQTKPETPSVFRKILSVDDEKYSITMPMDAYTAIKINMTILLRKSTGRMRLPSRRIIWLSS